MPPKGRGSQGSKRVGESGLVLSRKSVQISSALDAQIKSLLASLSDHQGPQKGDDKASSSTIGMSDTQKTLKQVSSVYDQLKAHGFKQPHVEQVLRELPWGSASLEAALDWLCLHLPQADLPKLFQGGVRAGGTGSQVRVVSVTHLQQQQQQQGDSRGLACDAFSEGGSEDEEDGRQGDGGDERRNGEGSDESEDEGESEEQSGSESEDNGQGESTGQQKAGPASEKAEGEGKGEDEREAAKAWIRQQYMEESGSEEASSSDSDFDDFALWADPREVQRRKQERAQAKVPPEIRRRQVAHEMHSAKQHAANAKASRDKSKQKEVGAIIRDLRVEMSRLHLTEDAAAAIVEEDCRAAGGAGKEGSANQGAGTQEQPQQQQSQQQQSQEQQQGEEPGDFEFELDIFAEESSQPPGASNGGSSAQGKDGGQAPAAAAAAAEEEAADDWETAFDLFEAAGDEESTQHGSSSRQDAAADDAAAMGVSGTAGESTTATEEGSGVPAPAVGKKKGKASKGGTSAAARQQAQQKAAAAAARISAAVQPRALLFQQCQRTRWAQPRYEKLPGVMQYSITLDMGLRAPKGSAARRKGHVGVRTFTLPEVEEGEEPWAWSNAQDAQNAVATRVLFELFGEEQALHHSMALPFKDYWLRWEAKGAQAQNADLQEAQQAKDAFMQQLYTEKMGEQAAAKGGRAASSVASVSVASSVTASSVASVSVASSVTDSTQASDSGEGKLQQEESGIHNTQAVDTVEQEEWREMLQDYDAETDQQQGEGLQGVQSYSPDVPQSPAERRTSQALRTALERWWASPAGHAMCASRHALPISAVRDMVHEALRQHDVVVVSGDTGCGKTTQVPQYLMEEACLSDQGARCNVVCTQPRRIAAISVAERVAAERGEPSPASGPPGASTVGYHVRLDAAVTRDTRLTFCTTGILLRRLAADPMLSSISHVVVDEVHERSLQSDFLMALLKELVLRRRGLGIAPLKVILMSATLDATAFADYFGGCPVLEAAGRTFPVEAVFLEDVYRIIGYRLAPDAPAAMRSGGARANANAMRRQAGGGNRDMQKLFAGGWGDEEKGQGALNPNYSPDMYIGYDEVTCRNLARVNEDAIDFELLEELVAFIDDDLGEEGGAILVFLPGMGEISQLLSRLSSTRKFSRGNHWLIPLHSSVSPAEQRQAFKVPPRGVRKIVLATNIAETSLTIEDVVAVVDSGKHKERRYDPARRMSLLVSDWVSCASAKQRKGRAGRVRPGTCFCLYTKHRFETLMRPFGAPEIVRVPLEELVLQIHLMGLGTASSFLARVLQPPPQKSVAAAVATLREVGAFPSEGPEVLTPLGHHLAQLPVDPRLGKLLVLGCVLGCLGPAASMAAAMSHKQPFVAPMENRDEAEKARRSMADKDSGNIASGQQSDHLLLVAALNGWLALGADQRKPQAHQAQLRAYLKKFFLHEQTLKELQEMRVQFASMLEDARLVNSRAHAAAAAAAGQIEGAFHQHWLDSNSAPWNRYARNPAVVKALLAAALVPNVASMSDASSPSSAPSWLSPVNRSSAGTSTGGGSVGVAQLEEVFVHPSSVCHNVATVHMSQPFVVYLEKIKTSRTFLRDVTPVSPISLMLFGGPLTVMHQEGTVLVDGWIRVRAAAQTAVVVKALREALDRLLQEKVRTPGLDLSGPRAQVIPTIATLLQDDEQHQQHLL